MSLPFIPLSAGRTKRSDTATSRRGLTLSGRGSLNQASRQKNLSRDSLQPGSGQPIFSRTVPNTRFGIPIITRCDYRSGEVRDVPTGIFYMSGSRKAVIDHTRCTAFDRQYPQPTHPSKRPAHRSRATIPSAQLARSCRLWSRARVSSRPRGTRHTHYRSNCHRL